MIIISDTSAISNLILIDRLDILQKVFNHIIIPTSVDVEVRALSQFQIDLTVYTKASWITVQDPREKSLHQLLLKSLDAGEAAAIALACELQADFLVIDERAGRKTAKDLGLKIIGLVGIFSRAKNLGIIDKVKPLLDKLISEANFYISQKFYLQILADLNERA